MVRQYIGARYTTKIYENSIDPSSAEWEANVTYEPLTLVTYNNSSYLSKKEVPGNIGNPAANPIYWVVTGAYNGQIATLQQQIDNINTSMSYNPVNVKDFGAVGDGITDDTQAFSDMISSGAKEMYVPYGEYVISGHFELDDDTILFGEGIIVDNRSTSDFNFEGIFNMHSKDNVTISGLTFEGRGVVSLPTWDGAYVYAEASTRIHYHNLTVLDSDLLYCIVLRNCSHSLIDYCKVISYSHCAIANLEEGSFDTIDHCYVYHCAGTFQGNSYGIVIHSGNTRPITGHHFWCTNNYVEDNPYWEGIDAHGGDYITCDNNTVVKCKHGIAIFRDDARTITCNHARITNNTIVGFDTIPAAEAVYYGLLVGADHSYIAFNDISKYGTDGALTTYEQAAACDVRQCFDTIFEGNVLHDNTGVCMHFRRNVDRLVIRNNIFTNNNPATTATSGYYNYVFFFTSGTFGEIDIENNTMRDYDCISYNSLLNDLMPDYENVCIRFRNNSYDNGMVMVRPHMCVPDYTEVALTTVYGKIGDIVPYITASDPIMFYMCTQSSVIKGDGTTTAAVWRALS